MRAAVMRAYHRPLELTDCPARELTRPDEVLDRLREGAVLGWAVLVP